ncbi:MAG TPA: hypothetical protein VNM89_02730 [Solirubrobacterales bacterium]|nr:hypothetical protein [Solirubrobacterales bacterium]
MSRHAKNRMRRHKLTRDEVFGVVAAENRRGEDPDGNPIYVKEVRGILLFAIVALDDGTLITIYDLRT